MQGKIFYKDAHNLINNGEKENILFCLSKVDLHAWISGHKLMVGLFQDCLEADGMKQPKHQSTIAVFDRWYDIHFITRCVRFMPNVMGPLTVFYSQWMGLKRPKNLC